MIQISTFPKTGIENDILYKRIQNDFFGIPFVLYNLDRWKKVGKSA
jgi:hypothetical protein